jgi:hypothetical protein
MLSVKGECKFKPECVKSVHCYYFNGTYFVNKCRIMTVLLVQTEHQFLSCPKTVKCSKISHASFEYFY